MADEKYIMFSLEEDTRKVAEILGNATCKKILNLLAEKEASETDIANELNSPVNTVEYNLKKLVGVGLVEKTSNFFWSTRGKKIPMYKAARKHIVISPRNSNIKNIFVVAIVSAILAFFVKIYTSNLVKEGIQQAQQTNIPEKVSSSAGASMDSLLAVSPSQPQIWPWFLLGSFIALLLVLILNWKKL